MCECSYEISFLGENRGYFVWHGNSSSRNLGESNIVSSEMKFHRNVEKNGCYSVIFLCNTFAQSSKLDMDKRGFTLILLT